jgi:hypothetical protein
MIWDGWSSDQQVGTLIVAMILLSIVTLAAPCIFYNFVLTLWHGNKTCLNPESITGQCCNQWGQCVTREECQEALNLRKPEESC